MGWMLGANGGEHELSGTLDQRLDQLTASVLTAKIVK
jgi:hypothetical protein